MTEDNSADDGDQVTTAVDYLKQQADLLAEAASTLPLRTDQCSRNVSDDKPLKQAVYACLDCTNAPGKPSGICYACSVSCHGSHRIEELFVKRDFVCDCATGRIDEVECQLVEVRSSHEHLNAYNHNFWGKYCVCDTEWRPDSADECVMLQCFVCEDWLHDKCLVVSSKVPSEDEFEDMLCMQCTSKYPFLLEMHLDETAEVDVVNENGKRELDDCCKRSASATTKVGLCIFTPVGHPLWTLVCKCLDCMHLYTKHKLSFLIQDEHIYQPEVDGGAQDDDYERGLQALEQVEPERVRDQLAAFNDLRTEMRSFLSQFANSGKVVSETDVHSFFDSLRKK